MEDNLVPLIVQAIVKYWRSGHDAGRPVVEALVTSSVSASAQAAAATGSW